MYGSLTVYPGMTPPIEARTTSPSDPGEYSSAQRGALAYAAWSLGVSDLWGEYNVNHDSALTYSAVWACVRVISESLSGIGWHAFERKPENQRFRFPILDDVAWLLQLQANPETSAFDWRQVMLKDALTWGNGYAEIERTNSGKPLWLWQIHPSRVEVIRDDNNRLWYEVDNGPGEQKSYLRPENMFHLKGVGPDGIVGWSIVELARKSIQLGLQEESFGSDFFSRGIMPGGIVKIPGTITHDARNEYRKSFERLYSGQAAHHRVVVVSGGVEFTPTTLPNNDAQFLESRTFQVQEICRWYGVPPHKLADLVRATFSNIEEQERAFVTDCLLPWARRLESEADIKLFGPVKRGRRFTRLNLDALMRGNSQTQTDTVTKKVASGLLTLDEAREYLDLNPYEGGLGETPLIQGAMMPLERVLEEPEPEPQPTDPATDPTEPTEPDEQTTPDPEAIRRVFGCLLVDVYSRLVRVTTDKVTRAANKGKLAEHISEWYTGSAKEDAKRALLPTFHALGIALRFPASRADELAQVATDRHCAKLHSELSERGTNAIGGWSTWPSEAATLDLKGAIS